MENNEECKFWWNHWSAKRYKTCDPLKDNFPEEFECYTKRYSSLA